jgi:hypothetical protein
MSGVEPDEREPCICVDPVNEISPDCQAEHWCENCGNHYCMTPALCQYKRERDEARAALRGLADALKEAVTAP